MPDSHLNGAERTLQPPFRNRNIFNGLIMAVAVGLAYLPIRALPDRLTAPPNSVALRAVPVELPAAQEPLRLAGAWNLQVADRRFGGLSALALDRGRFLAVSDRGSVIRFDKPFVGRPAARLADLRAGPGIFGKKFSRDAESLARDPGGRGWWVGYEQHHSLWLYDESFDRGLASIDLVGPEWRDNRGAEGLLTLGDGLLVVAESGREALRAGNGGIEKLKLKGGAEVADAAEAPDGSQWLLLRAKGIGGLEQWIATLVSEGGGYRAGRAWPVPKAAFDNYEGMAIELLPDGRWRFWLITDDGHRLFARTLLVALDYSPPARNGKSPAKNAGLSKEPTVSGP
jgi:hypothetical protein